MRDISEKLDKVIEIMTRMRAPLGPSAGVSESEIEAFEERTGLSLCPELRAWYRLSNGWEEEDLMPLVRREQTPPDLWTVEDYIVQYRDDYQGWIPIGTDGCGGQYVVFSLDGKRPVGYLDTDDQSRIEYIFASSPLCAIYATLVQREKDNALVASGDPYFEEEYIEDDDGAAELALDPGLAEFAGCSIPRLWETG